MPLPVLIKHIARVEGQSLSCCLFETREWKFVCCRMPGTEFTDEHVRDWSAPEKRSQILRCNGFESEFCSHFFPIKLAEPRVYLNGSAMTLIPF